MWSHGNTEEKMNFGRLGSELQRKACLKDIKGGEGPFW